MFKKRITYLDYNGNELTQDFYFNLSKAELLDMQLSTAGGFSEMAQKIIDARDVPEIVHLFKQLILMSYGEKSADGKRFIKSDELTKAFTETEAFVNLYMELTTDTDFAIEFLNGVVPAEMRGAMTKAEVLEKAKTFAKTARSLVDEDDAEVESESSTEITK